MPCITSTELSRRGDVQKEVSERSLQSVEGEVEYIERDDSESDGGACNLRYFRGSVLLFKSYN